jgi:MOSC domain-containing protein YiiM
MPVNEHPFNWETPPEIWRGFRSPTAEWQAQVVSIFVAPRAAEEMVALAQVRAFADRGLEGDRFLRDSWHALKRPDKAVTFIEEETLASAEAELGVKGLAQRSRRNIVTRGVPLVQLLDRQFVVGDVLFRGIRLFEPCGHLVRLSGLQGIFKALEHRSGLKAAILSNGLIRVGDAIAPVTEARQSAAV